MKPCLLAVCHDAGGAEVISSWVLRHTAEWDVSYLLAGPAVPIFDRKIPIRPQGHGTCSFVLCGSSGDSPWERTALSAARSTGIPCAVYLDHWRRYRERLDELPDEIWVCDGYAEAIAQGAFPETPVINQGNPYLDDFRWEYHRLMRSRVPSTHERVLWVDEPGRRREFRLYARTVRGAEIRVRLHPSTPRESYKAALGAYAGSYGASVAGPEESLAENVAWADTVAGCDSMALVAALSVGKRVISAIPAEEAFLPHALIERPFG